MFLRHHAMHMYVPIPVPRSWRVFCFVFTLRGFLPGNGNPPEMLRRQVTGNFPPPHFDPLLILPHQSANERCLFTIENPKEAFKKLSSSGSQPFSLRFPNEFIGDGLRSHKPKLPGITIVFLVKYRMYHWWLMCYFVIADH